MAENMSLTEWRARANRLATSVKNIKIQSAEIGERALGGGAAVVAGYGVGILVKKGYDKPIPNTEIPVIPAAAAVLALAGVGGLAGKMSDLAVHVGSGALAGYAAITAAR